MYLCWSLPPPVFISLVVVCACSCISRRHCADGRRVRAARRDEQPPSEAEAVRGQCHQQAAAAVASAAATPTSGRRARAPPTEATSTTKTVATGPSGRGRQRAWTDHQQAQTVETTRKSTASPVSWTLAAQTVPYISVIIIIIIIIVIMFVYSIDDITRNVQSTSATQGGTGLYTERLSSAKLLPHTAHSGW